MRGVVGKLGMVGLWVAVWGNCVEAGDLNGEPSMSALLKPTILKKVMDEREVMVHAALTDEPVSPAPLPPFAPQRGSGVSDSTQSPLKKYSFYAAMLVRAGLEKTRKILTDYQLYPKMISYVDLAQYSPPTHILRVEGGIWKFRLASWVQFDEKSDRWIHFKVVGGHFRGLTGDLFFEPKGDAGTAVYFRGEQQGRSWPPQFVIERGAEIVFGFTARRMRSFIEASKSNSGANDDSKDKEVPQPRNSL